MKVWTKEEIVKLLNTNDIFISRSVVKIFERQTEDEKETDSTNNSNGIGFNGTDAFIMSQFAKFYIKNGYLSAKQLVIAKRKIMKYATQLTGIANAMNAAINPETRPVISVKPCITGRDLAGWDGHSRRGQAIYDALFEQEKDEMDEIDRKLGIYDQINEGL